MKLKFHTGHFLMVLISAGFLYGVLFTFIIPLLDSVTTAQLTYYDSEGVSQSIELFLSQWLSLILVLVFLAIGYFKTRDDHSKNISYLTTGLIIIILYALF